MVSAAFWLGASGLFFFAQSVDGAQTQVLAAIPFGQQEVGDEYLDHGCGIASLCAAARLLGREVTFADVCGLLKQEDRPRHLRELSDAARALGLTTKPMRWKRGQQLSFPTPAILHLCPARGNAPGHFIVGAVGVHGVIQVIDCPFAPTWVSETELWDYWDGVALYLATQPSDLSGLETHRSWWTILAALGLGANSLAICLWLIASVWSCVRAGLLNRGGARGNLAWKPVGPIVALFGLAVGAWASDALTRTNKVSTRPPMAVVVTEDHFKELKISDRSLHQSGDTAKVSFRLRNEGMELARIVKVISSCTCASIDLEPRSLAPRGESTVHVKVDMVNESERDVRATVVFDEHVIPSSITLRARVRRTSGQ